MHRAGVLSAIYNLLILIRKRAQFIDSSHHCYKNLDGHAKKVLNTVISQNNINTVLSKELAPSWVYFTDQLGNIIRDFLEFVSL